MRMDIWIDNRVINLDQPTDFFNNNVDNSEMFVDFVEISGSDGPSIEREIGGNILIWDTPNSFPNGEQIIYGNNTNLIYKMILKTFIHYWFSRKI